MEAPPVQAVRVLIGVLIEEPDSEGGLRGHLSRLPAGKSDPDRSAELHERRYVTR